MGTFSLHFVKSYSPTFLESTFTGQKNGDETGLLLFDLMDPEMAFNNLEKYNVIEGNSEPQVGFC